MGTIETKGVFTMNKNTLLAGTLGLMMLGAVPAFAAANTDAPAIHQQTGSAHNAQPPQGQDGHQPPEPPKDANGNPPPDRQGQNGQNGRDGNQPPEPPRDANGNPLPPPDHSQGQKDRPSPGTESSHSSSGHTAQNRG